MFAVQRKIILASGSPRRRELLARMGYVFETCSPDVDEHAEGHAKDIVQLLAQRKGRAAARNYEDAIVIASDTLVSLDGKALGKPADEADAAAMLRSLSGREHEVFTGVCMIDTRTGRTEVFADRTGVTFRELSDKEIADYIATGEPMDKAGAYGIQGGASVFVEKLDGSFENVMGFPVEPVGEMLTSFMND